VILPNMSPKSVTAPLEQEAQAKEGRLTSDRTHFRMLGRRRTAVAYVELHGDLDALSERSSHYSLEIDIEIVWASCCEWDELECG
jgi:hypothetical protein